MKRCYVLLFLLIMVLSSGARKKVVVAQPQWPDGSQMSEWFTDTAKVDVKTFGKQYVITKYGVKNDPTILQTERIQAVIDRCADEGGGVVVIPRGTFLSGALFFKQGTHLHFEDEAVLKGINDIRHYPIIRMHMEGQMIDYFSALVTVQNIDGFTITGNGTIDGNGLRFWEEFFIRRKWNKKCTNLEALRPQLVYVSDSRNVTVQDVRLINSPFWTNHFYRCERIKYLDCHIEAPTFGEVDAPSSDALDFDVCSDVVVRGCYMNTCDDAVCLKGGKGTYVDRDSTAGSVGRILVEQCRFGKRCYSGVTFGSESWNSHNVVMRNCKFEGAYHMLLFKMRSDTPQQYGDMLVENCTGNTRVSAVEASTWSQFANRQKRDDMPVSSVRNVTIRNIDFKTAIFFRVVQKHPFTLHDFTFENVKVSEKYNSFEDVNVEGMTLNNVIINGIKK